jgi:hypothetical protein
MCYGMGWTSPEGYLRQAKSVPGASLLACYRPYQSPVHYAFQLSITFYERRQKKAWFSTGEVRHFQASDEKQ